MKTIAQQDVPKNRVLKIVCTKQIIYKIKRYKRRRPSSWKTPVIRCPVPLPYTSHPDLTSWPVAPPGWADCILYTLGSMVTQYTLSSLPFYAGDLELCIRKSALRLVYNILGNNSEHPMAILSFFLRNCYLSNWPIFFKCLHSCSVSSVPSAMGTRGSGVYFVCPGRSYASCTIHRYGNLTTHPSHTHLQVSDPI